jgi:VanZ family protein
MPEISLMAAARRAPLRSLAPLALMAAIFYLSAQHGDPDQSWWVAVIRKLGHIGGYATLTALWTWALAGSVRRPLPTAIAISLAYAISDEYHQTYVETRHGSPIDVGVDAIGIAVAALLISRWPRAARTGPARARASISARLPGEN